MARKRNHKEIIQAELDMMRDIEEENEERARNDEEVMMEDLEHMQTSMHDEMMDDLFKDFEDEDCFDFTNDEDTFFDYDFNYDYDTDYCGGF